MTFSGAVLAQALVSGVMLGSVFALVSIGLTLIWGVMKIINFAHGEFLTAGLYVAYFLVADGGWHPYVTVIATVPAVVLLGLIVFKATIQPILEDPVMNQIMLTMGLSLILQNVFLILFRADVRSTYTGLTDQNITIGSVVVSLPELVALIVCLCVFAGMHYLLKKTELGRKIRAAAQDPSAARLQGIDVARMYLYAFSLGSATLGIAAAVLIPHYTVFPGAGLYLGLVAFIVVVLGGMGNIAGCLLAGLIMGLAEAVGAGLLPGSVSRAFMFGVFIVLLIFLPRGILARREA